MGDTGSGKTGALASLADAGYNLRILDIDNGLDILRNVLMAPSSPYNKSAIERVTFRTIREPMRRLGGRLVPAKAVIWEEVAKQLMDWKDTDADGKEISLGPVTSWSPQEVLVVDTLTALSWGAWNWHCQMNGKLGGEVTGFEYQRFMGQVQTLLEGFLNLLADSSVKCNVIVNSHVTYVRDPGMPKPKDDEADPVHGYPSAIGKALSPRIPRFFNSALLVKVDGFGAFAKHKIYPHTQGIVPAKSSNPFGVAREYGIEKGLAEYFAAVRGAAPTAPVPTPAPVAAPTGAVFPVKLR